LKTNKENISQNKIRNFKKTEKNMNFEEDYFTTSLNQDEFNDEDLKRRTKKKEVALFRRRRH